MKRTPSARVRGCGETGNVPHTPPTDVGGVVQGSAPLSGQSVTGGLTGAMTTLTRSATLAGVVEVG